MRRALWLALLLALLALALATAGVGAAPSASKAAAKDPNPCFAPVAANLRCPDLVMRRPYGLRVDRQTRRGRSLLRAGNSIDSLGAGPAELRGRRSGGKSGYGVPDSITAPALQRVRGPVGTGPCAE